MILKYKNDYNSIKKFDDVEIKDFAIFTGINGAGKTHLLEAIEKGHIDVSSISVNDIAYFNFKNFEIKNESPTSPQAVRQEKNGLWTVFGTTTNILPLKNHFLNLKQPLTSENIKIIKNIVLEKKKPLLSLSEDDFENNSELIQLFKNYYISIDTIKHEQNSDPRIIELAYGYEGFLDEISEEDFLDMIKVNLSVENFLTQQISQIFLNFNDRILSEFLSLLKTNGGDSADNSMKNATNKILKKYGGKYPWNFINEMLDSFSDFKYKIIAPPEPDLDDISRNKNVGFTALLQHTNSDLTINFEDLSSGEKILLALAIVLFDSVDKHHFPKLVLLDEIDSSLHPTMVKNLLMSLENTFTNNRIKIILVTHSPTTVAYAPDDSIYLIDTRSQEPIKITDKSTALDKLTQGFMTLHDGNIIFDSINNHDLTIFSEGNNIKYIQTAIELHCENISGRIHIWSGIEGKIGESQLKALYDLLNNINLKKKILIVFDPEVNLTVETNEDKLIFVTKLQKVENKFGVKGIESVLPENAFEGFLINRENELIGKTESIFPSNHKTSLCEKLTSERNPEIFENFKPLTDEIRELLN